MSRAKPNRLLSVVLCLAITLCFWGCTTTPEPQSKPGPVAKQYLWEFYEDYFPIGAATSASRTNHPLLPHFNSITAESQMKWGRLQPIEGEFAWETNPNYDAGRLVEYAKQTGKLVRGHTLVWYKSMPDWVLAEGTTKAQALDRMRTHIDRVIKHFGADVYCWDVVNEAILNAPTQTQTQTGNFYRTGANETTDIGGFDWYAVCGRDYIKEAFIAARQAVNEIGADIKLFYNEYGLLSPAKRDAAVALIEWLRAEGVRVDGIGMQAHYRMASFDLAEFETTIKTFVDMGLEVQLTELDLSIYHSSIQKQIDPLPLETEAQQAEIFSSIFEVARRYSLPAEEGKGAVTSITFWGISDDGTWLNNSPVQGRNDHPLLFDRDRQPKMAYYSILDFLND